VYMICGWDVVESLSWVYAVTSLLFEFVILLIILRVGLPFLSNQGY
jgi:hypothetical protein